jgi:uncharacterized protein (DUF2336 family)
VFEPIIRLSPLLTTEDLLTLVAMAPAAGTVLAVAHRAELEPAVSDAIAASADNTAIRALLANPSAQIREATLDVLVARSVNHPDWHEPLVRRPSLPPRAARLLSELLATHLLAELATRADLAPPLAEELRRRIAIRLAPAPEPPAAPLDTTAEDALAQARATATRGELVEETLLAAARRGETRHRSLNAQSMADSIAPPVANIPPNIPEAARSCAPSCYGTSAASVGLPQAALCKSRQYRSRVSDLAYKTGPPAR